ncbi:MAG: ester cyclase [Anaerolineales bacterium]
MSEENKAIARRFFEEVWNQGNLKVVDELLGPDFVASGVPSGIPPHREGFKEFVTMNRAAFPDMNIYIEDQIAEGDLVITRFKIRGTHQGVFAGIPPTNKQVTGTGIGIDRIVDGRIVEAWTNYDEYGMLVQLGAIPAPGEGGG